MFGFVWKKRLVSLVKKIENSEHGVFININNDLGCFIENNIECDPLLKMAYGYARRFAMAGLYLQKLAESEDYNHVVNMFKGLQQLTDGSVKFQEKAVDQAVELIQSYSNLFDRKSIKFLVFSVENGVDRSILGEGIQPVEKIAFVVNGMKDNYFKN
jgi:hypothetical protein